MRLTPTIPFYSGCAVSRAGQASNRMRSALVERQFLGINWPTVMKHCIAFDMRNLLSSVPLPKPKKPPRVEFR